MSVAFASLCPVVVGCAVSTASVQSPGIPKTQAITVVQAGVTLAEEVKGRRQHDSHKRCLTRVVQNSRRTAIIVQFGA